MFTTDTVVIGAGHAGLAVSRLLTDANRDHVVLDRGRVAERWRTERWDSLNLLTPNWMSRLPGWLYSGGDQEGYMSAGRLVGHLEKYAHAFAAPVETGTTVLDVSAAASGYRVVTDRGTWQTRHVVIATGPWGRPHVPETMRSLPDHLRVTTANQYRNPAALPPGGVLVVGASSSGTQIADELTRSGREVVLAVGGHTRMPRRYRGIDIFWWLERTGRLSRTIDELADVALARREPSLQLIGRNEPERSGEDLDLANLQTRGVRLTGRLEGIERSTASFRDDLVESNAIAERRMHRFLDSVDRHIQETGLTREVLSPARPPSVAPVPAPATLNLKTQGINTVLFATGYRPDNPWLSLPITAPDGSIRQHRGVTAAPGVYVVGQRFQHRRDSSFIDGARHDARAIVAHLTAGEAATVSNQGISG
jgi:putative flavoprotein involved in K+ transport